MTTEKKRQPKIYKDARGMEIPSTYLHKIDREKDAIARKFHKQALKLREQLTAFKAEVLAKCDELYKRALAENRIILREDSKGSYTISTIDKDIQLTIKVSEFQQFDDTINIARLKLKEYLNEISEGANEDIQLLVNAAFETSRGRMDVKKVTSLFNLAISHPKWKEAMELIQKSMYVNNSKRYLQIKERNTTTNEYEAIVLDIAAL